MDFEETDVFGVFSGEHPPASLTYAQYVAWVVGLAARTGHAGDVFHAFLLDDLCCAAPASIEQYANVSATSVNPALCAHLAREGVAAMLAAPELIPTVVCSFPDGGERDRHALRGHVNSSSAEPIDPVCRHGAPHVHCLYCLALAVEANGGAAPPIPQSGLVGVPARVCELRECWADHFQYHAQHSRKLLEMLEGDRVAYVGDSDGDDQFDLETDDGFADCEALAAGEARHGCFLISAGTPRCPVVIAFCAECRQFAPLARFTAETTSANEAAVASRSECLCQSAACGAWLAQDDGLLVLARLLLAAHMLAEGRRQHLMTAPAPDEAEAVGESSRLVQATIEPHVEEETVDADPSWVFLYKPEFFDLDSEPHLIDQFEDGCECTHGGAVLPAACVVGSPPHPRLLLLDEAREYVAPFLRTASMAPPYTFTAAVVGFLMDFASPAVAQEKMRMAMQHDNRLRTAVRMVFVEDTQTWELAHVLYHYREEEEQERKCPELTEASGAVRAEKPGPLPAEGALPALYSDPADPAQCIREARDYTVSVGLPSVLWQRFALSLRTEEDGAAAERAGAAEMDGLPFSLQSRTINFFGAMTVLARAMTEALAHQRAVAHTGVQQSRQLDTQ